MDADGCRANCIQCVGGCNLKTCLDVGHLFKNFWDTLYMIIQMSTALKRGWALFVCFHCYRNYSSLTEKSTHGRSTLQVCQRGGWVLFRLFPHLTTKECPRHVYKDLKPSKQITGHKITYNGITNGFEVKS